MDDIKVGDTVVCKDNAGYKKKLTINKKYKVKAVFKNIFDDLRLTVDTDDKSHNSFHSKMFKKVEKEETKDSESNIKVGDKVTIKEDFTGNDYLTFDKEYAVEEIQSTLIGVLDDRNNLYWLFKSDINKVETTSQPAAKPAGGLKYDSNKPPVDLVPREAIEAAARAFGFGARKYAAHNFKLGLQYSRLAGAVQRHLIAFMDNESIDPESRLSHLDHAMSALSMLVYMSQNKPEMDDRFNKQTLKLNNET